MTQQTDALEERISTTLSTAHREAIVKVVRELGRVHSLEKILELLDNGDRTHVLSLRPVDLVDPPQSGSNGHADAVHAALVPAGAAPTPVSAASPKPTASTRRKTPPRPKPEKPASKKAAKKPAAKKASKPAKKPAAKKASKPAKKPPKATASAPEAASTKPNSEKARVAQAVATHVGKLAKGARFKTSDVLAALGTNNKDTATRVKIVAALRLLEDSGVLGHEGDGRASTYVVS